MRNYEQSEDVIAETAPAMGEVRAGTAVAVEADGGNLRIELENALDTQQVTASPETADPSSVCWITRLPMLPQLKS